MAMDVNVVATGSGGNFSIIDDHVVFDCGVKCDLVRPYLDAIDAIIISHEHSDHVSIPVLRMIARERPSLLRRVFVNASTWEKVNELDPRIGGVIEPLLFAGGQLNVVTRSNSYRLECFPLVHDVENYGFILTNYRDGSNLLYATDTTSLMQCPDRLFDVMMVEGNWDETTLVDDVASGDPSRVFRASRNTRHLSVQAMEKFVRERYKAGSVVFQLHKSDTYGVDAGLMLSGKFKSE